MEAWLRLSLLLLVTPVPISASSLQEPPESGQDTTALAEALAVYNRAPEVTSVFRLYEADPETKQDVSISGGQLQFKIKETECLKQVETQNLEKCAFKNYGVVKECTATMFTNTLAVSCVTIVPKTQVRRPRQAKECTTKNKKRVCKGKGNGPNPGKFGPLSPDDL